MPTIPNNFDGQAFAEFYNLGIYDFTVDGSELTCPSLPNLTDEDLIQFVIDVDRYERIKDRQSNAKADAKNIPQYATWSAATAQQWWLDNLSDAQVDAINDFASLREMIKKQNAMLAGLARMTIALRNKTWPDLPE